MIPSERFVGKPKYFWAHVRTISQGVGYTRKGEIKIPSLEEILVCLEELGLRTDHVVLNDKPTAFGTDLLEYFAHRALTLHRDAEVNLMDSAEAKSLFGQLRAELKPNCPLPQNKQKKEKKDFAFMTCIVNMLIEAHSEELPCNYNPLKLTTFTRDQIPLRTLARRVDGAFTSLVNPIAIWEIKEYYYTTTFGSRVADGVYESLLDGLELEDLREQEDVNVLHYLMVDSHFTWWTMGKSYLCRLVDMLHMGYVDEVLFGKEVVQRLPTLVSNWVKLAQVG